MDLRMTTLALGIALGAVAAIAGAGLYALNDRPATYSDVDRQQLNVLVKRAQTAIAFE